ncbi:MAG: MFS transporter, partial [Chitinivibrionales bacterium]|nr:MFS transporter [Chitinivibrionales bacterium]
MNPLLYFRLSVMFLLGYTIWGALAGILPIYLSSTPAQGGLGFNAGQVGMILGMGASVGAITAPFIAGQLADRYFRTERFLAVCFLLAGIMKWLVATQHSYSMWLLLSAGFSVVFLPTISLANSLAFRHLKDAVGTFGYIRVWGVVGYVVALWGIPILFFITNRHLSWIPPFIVGDQVPNATAMMAKGIKFSAVISFIMSAYCLTLPKTPPKREGTDVLAFREAFAMFKSKSYTVLIITSVPISILASIFWMKTGPFFEFLGMPIKNISPALSVANITEVFMFIIMGFMLKYVGIRGWIMIGCLGLGARFLMFALYHHLPIWALVASESFHGLWGTAFFGAAYIYVDKLAPPDARASAQTVFSILMLGLGGILAGYCLP